MFSSIWFSDGELSGFRYIKIIIIIVNAFFLEILQKLCTLNEENLSLFLI